MSLVSAAQIAYMRSEAKKEPIFPIYCFDIDYDDYKATSLVAETIANEVEPAASRMMKGMSGYIYHMPAYCIGYLLETFIDKYGFDDVAIRMSRNGDCEYEFGWM